MFRECPVTFSSLTAVFKQIKPPFCRSIGVWRYSSPIPIPGLWQKLHSDLFQEVVVSRSWGINMMVRSRLMDLVIQSLQQCVSYLLVRLRPSNHFHLPPSTLRPIQYPVVPQLLSLMNLWEQQRDSYQRYLNTTSTLWATDSQCVQTHRKYF